MTVPDQIAVFVALLLLVTALSHVLQPRLWAMLFRDLIDKPYAGLVVGLPPFMIGSLIVTGHWVWEGSASLIVTLIGCAWTIKGTLYLLYPGLLRRVAGRHLDRPEHFRWAGMVLLALGGAVAAYLIARSA